MQESNVWIKGTVINWKSTDKWSLTYFKSILKISHSNYLTFCSNLPVKLPIFLKSGLLLTVSIVIFLLINKTLRFNNLNTRTAIQKRKCFLFVLKRSYICFYIICMIVPLRFRIPNHRKIKKHLIVLFEQIKIV